MLGMPTLPASFFLLLPSPTTPSMQPQQPPTPPFSSTLPPQLSFWRPNTPPAPSCICLRVPGTTPIAFASFQPVPSPVWPCLPLRLAVLAAREVWRVVPKDTSLPPIQLVSISPLRLFSLLLIFLVLFIPRLIR